MITLMRLRIALLRMDEVWEFVRIAQEEDRRVVPDHVPIAVFGVELDCEPSHVAVGVGATRLGRNVREPRHELGPLADAVEHLRLRVLGHVVLEFEIAEGARALGMHDAFRNALAIEVRVLFEEPRIFDHDWTAGTGGHRDLVRSDGHAAPERQRAFHLARRPGVFPEAVRRAREDWAVAPGRDGRVALHIRRSARLEGLS